MVPTFTCGLLRSNFSFATLLLLLSQSLFSGHLARTCRTYSLSAGSDRLASAVLDDLFGDVRRHLVVPIELHRVGGAPLGGRAQVGRIAEHLGERHAAPNRDRVAAR